MRTRSRRVVGASALCALVAIGFARAQDAVRVKADVYDERKLQDAGVKVEALECTDRGHLTIVSKIGSENDELTDAVVKFVKETAAAK